MIREAYRRAAAEGLHAAIEYLQVEVPNRKWDTDRARKLFVTRTYLGESRTGEAGPTSTQQAPRLTTLEDWTAAQTAPRGRRANGDYLLTGIARCVCGAGLTGQLQSFTNREQTYRRYRCSNPACRGGSSIDAGQARSGVRDLLESGLADVEFRARFVPGDLAAAREALEAAESELDTFVSVVPATSRAFATGYTLREQALEAAHGEYRTVAGCKPRALAGAPDAGAARRSPEADHVRDRVRRHRPARRPARTRDARRPGRGRFFGRPR